MINFVFRKTGTALLTALLIAGGFVVFASNAKAAETTDQATQSYVIRLNENDSTILTAIPGLTNIQPLYKSAEINSDGANLLANTYRFESTSSIDVLSKTFEGFYIYLEVDARFENQARIKEIKQELPNDPGFTEDPLNIDRQWGLHKAKFVKAWDTTIGVRNVVVAVIDTGIDATHEDFAQTRFVSGYNVLTQKSISRKANSDDNGHGTLVSGVIAATSNNEKGIAGAAPGISLMAIKALDSDGTGTSTDISEAIVWAANHGANIINLSLGGIGFAHDTVLANSISYAFNKNVVLVAAAGNDVAITGGNLDKEPVFPICHDNGQNMVIGVTATDVNDLKPTFANFGKACVDVSAPGKRILSTINHDPSSGGAAINAYAYASGTSLAVPYVSAQAALLRSIFPLASNRQIRDRIIVSADKIDMLNLSQCADSFCAGLLGGGRINVAKSLETQIITLKDGDVVQIIGTTDYYLINGGKRQVISPFVRGQRFAKTSVKNINFSDIQYFPEGSYATPLDGTLVKSPNDPTVHYIQSGLRRPLTFQVFSMRGFQFKDIVTLTNVEIGSWVEGSFLPPPDGSLVRSRSNPTVYWVIDGTLHPINHKFYMDRGLSVFPVFLTSENDISKFPKGDPLIL